MSMEALEHIFSAENVSETAETFTDDALWRHYSQQMELALEQNDIATAKYYIGELAELCGDTDEADTEVLPEGQELTLGSSERSYLEKKIKNAERNLELAEKALAVLLRNKADNMKGVDSAISNRKYQIKVYTKEIDNLKRDLSRLKDEEE